MHSRKPTIIPLLAILGTATLWGQSGPTFSEGEDPSPETKTWELVEKMSDEFDGDQIDLEKWQLDPVGNSFNWVGRPPGLFQAKNVAVEGGNMRVEVGVLEEPVTIKGDTFTYYGAIIRSIAAGQPGWYYECRMKANATEMSSTFWLLSKGGEGEAQELDIQECVGKTSELTDKWGRNWDQIFHSNTIHWRYFSEPKRIQIQGQKNLDVKNHSRYFVYGAWWKSPEEIQFFLDGEYAYSIHPESVWDLPAYLHMAMETYDWNPVPEGGGMVAAGTKDQRTTKYDWIRTWKLTDK
ncbi:MAG: glycosyl hydrolase [Verrucomicrobiota bacterium]